MRDVILEKLREVEELLAGATCDGIAIAASDETSGVSLLHGELTSALNALVERVDYYVD